MEIFFSIGEGYGIKISKKCVYAYEMHNYCFSEGE